jgi:hypothetical protein
MASQWLLLVFWIIIAIAIAFRDYFGITAINSPLAVAAIADYPLTSMLEYSPKVIAVLRFHDASNGGF